jgi:hypothetical protein
MNWWSASWEVHPALEISGRDCALITCFATAPGTASIPRCNGMSTLYMAFMPCTAWATLVRLAADPFRPADERRQRAPEG